MGLDLYAKLEPLIPFPEEMKKLYTAYLKKLEKQQPAGILDIGCGGGNFMELALAKGFEIEGIDLSGAQVAMATSRGFKAVVKDLADVSGTYDAAVAVFDVLNYMDEEALGEFFQNAKKVLNPGGKFYADINTLFAFEEIAQGALLLHGDGQHGSMEAYFDGEKLHTELRLFTRKGDCYTMEEDTIIQHYHSLEVIRKLSPFKTMKVDNLALYSKKPDKFLITFSD